MVTKKVCDGCGSENVWSGYRVTIKEIGNDFDNLFLDCCFDLCCVCRDKLKHLVQDFRKKVKVTVTVVGK